MSYFTCTGEYIGNYCTNHKYVSSHKNNESDKCRQECENNTSCNGYFTYKPPDPAWENHLACFNCIGDKKNPAIDKSNEITDLHLCKRENINFNNLPETIKQQYISKNQHESIITSFMDKKKIIEQNYSKLSSDFEKLRQKFEKCNNTKSFIEEIPVSSVGYEPLPTPPPYTLPPDLGVRPVLPDPTLSTANYRYDCEINPMEICNNSEQFPQTEEMNNLSNEEFDIKCRDNARLMLDATGYFIKKSEIDEKNECHLCHGDEKRNITQEEGILMAQPGTYFCKWESYN